MRTILDISHHNTITDWNLVKEQVDAVVIRMGFRRYGSGEIVYDSNYREHRAACEAIGLPFSLYFFPCSITEEEAKEEADFVIREAQGMVFHLPIFADSEVADVKQGNGRADKLSREKRTKLLKVFCDRLQNAGIPAGIYASKAWLENNLDMTMLPYTIWVAQWAQRCTYGGQYLLWQFTSKGMIGGAQAPVDLSVCYDETQNLPRDAEDNVQPQPVPMKAQDRMVYAETAAQLVGIREESAEHRALVDIYNAHEPRARGYRAKVTDAWCALFVSAVAIMCEMTEEVVTEVSCGQMIERYKERGRWIEDDSFRPQPGDLIFYDWQDDGIGDNEGWPDHVGIVYSVIGSTMKIVEGNMKDAVGIREMEIGARYIRGYALPEFKQPAEDSITPVQVEQPAPEPVEEETGLRKVKAGILNIRREPDADAEDLGDLVRGSVVTIDRTVGGWGHIEGWIKLEHTSKG